MLVGPEKLGVGERFKGAAAAGLMMMDLRSEAHDDVGSGCRKRSKARRTGEMHNPVKLTADEESELILMLNDPKSELFRLFAHHNPNKSPQQCYLDLKYCPPDDLESKSLHEKVLKYAQLHRKLGRKMKREKARKPSECQVDEKPCQLDGGKSSKQGAIAVQQGDGCHDRADVKKRAENCALYKEKRCGRANDAFANPLKTCDSQRSARKNLFCDGEEDAEDAILESYQKALTTTNVGTDLRLALLDEELNKPAKKGCGDEANGCTLSSLLKPKRRQRSPPRNATGNCFVSRPVRANRIQHSLSSVSSIEVHKTNTTCSMSSTSISISTCEFVSKI